MYNMDIHFQLQYNTIQLQNQVVVVKNGKLLYDMAMYDKTYSLKTEASKM
jgi:hypothetical protein